MLKNFFDRIVAHYDKVLLFVVLAALLFSLAHLAVRLQKIQDREREILRRVEAMRPQHPEAQPINAGPYERALVEIRRPFTIPEWKGNLLVPETRVTCVDCRRPIPIEAEVCPNKGCGARQPEGGPAPGLDSDKDGMPDAWEIAQGFDPNDPRDALLDADGDLFRNVDEYLSKTDPRNRDDHPPYETALQVKELIPDPFMLRFKSSFRLPGRSVLIWPDGKVQPLADRSQIVLSEEAIINLPRKSALGLGRGARIEVIGLKLIFSQEGGETTALELGRNEGVQLPVEAVLRVPGKEAQELPAGCTIRSVIDVKFQINTRGNARTYFVKLGDVVEGFEVHKYDEIFVEDKQGRKEDVSVLSLKRGEKLIPLEKGKDVQYDEYTVHLVFRLDGTEFKLKKDEEFELMGRKYRLTAIDSKANCVVIGRTDEDKEWEISRHPVGGTGGEKTP